MTGPGTDQSAVLLLVRLGEEAGGRVDPERIARRRPDSASVRAFEEAKEQGYLDIDGWVTAIGREVLAQW